MQQAREQVRRLIQEITGKAGSMRDMAPMAEEGHQTMIAEITTGAALPGQIRIIANLRRVQCGAPFPDRLRDMTISAKRVFTFTVRDAERLNLDESAMRSAFAPVLEFFQHATRRDENEGGEVMMIRGFLYQTFARQIRAGIR